jgi:adenosine deaminase CECR1
MNLLFKFIVFFFLLFSNVNLLPLPFNQYAYMIARNKIKQQDRAIQSLNKLNSKERTVNLYLEYLQTKEYVDTRNYFYPARPIETEIENITNSPLYQFLIRLPKGGNLHIHEFQVLDRKILLESIQNSPEYDFLYICDQNSCVNNKYYLNYFKVNVPSGWTKVKDSNWTIPDIVRKSTLTGILNDLDTPIYATDAGSRWNLTNKYGVFDFYGDITKYNVTRFNYMKLVLDHALQENIQLLEFRRNLFGSLYYFNNNGSKILINPTEELDLLLKFKKDYLLKNPKFIDFVFVIYASRILTKDQIKLNINNLIDLQRLYPDFIRGYDLVGEEDQGHTLLFHSDNLINLFNYSKQSNNTFNLLFHAGETNWPDEYLPANYGDDVATLENIYDALVLRTRRIGHGIGLAKRPDLYDYIRQQQIAIEICPTSNQILGYVADLRNHPGIVYHRSGIPIVLAGDDPGSFGYNQLTVDFYMATMAWSLNLADLKQFAFNSIQYSSLPNNTKNDGFQKWTNQWNLFIDSSYQLACNQRFYNGIMNISDVLPSYGPVNQSINITIFGEGFQMAICKNIICKFGEIQTNGIFVDINEIICPTPLNNNVVSTVSISLVIGNTTVQSGFNYKFLSKLLIIDDGMLNSISSKPDQFGTINQKLIIILLTLLFIFII